ncbi:MAG: MarR family winged helix-turn-helix transcriptional regulator [Ferrovibrio sp.]|uniref:MarR family winged helix-turn-helix transcriptional regulator n=1 Tax=Ferrovibrio sp. TaxID=1917215 RepID=UPI00391A6A99
MPASVRNGTASEMRKGEMRKPDLRKADRRSPAPVHYGTLPNHVGYLLRLAQLRVWEDFYARIGPTGVSPALFSALMLIEHNPGLQQSRLGEALGVARSGAMAMVDRLERLGLVERRADPHDRRAYGLFLTAPGERQMAELIERVKSHDKLINQVLSQQEHDTLMRLLRKFIAAPALTGEAHSAPDNDPVASRTKRAGQTGRRQTISREDRP